MNYPDYKADLLITYEKPYTSQYINECFNSNIKQKPISIEIIEVQPNDLSSQGEWISYPSILSIFLTEKFILKHYLKATDSFQKFMILFTKFIKPTSEIITSIIKPEDNLDKRPTSPFSVYFEPSKDYIFQFIFHFQGDENDYQLAFLKILEEIVSYKKKSDKDIVKSIKDAYSQSNNKKYFIYIEKHWQVIDPLIEFSNEINKTYRQKTDFRIKKPLIFLHKDDYRKYFIFDTNWILHFDNLETLMIKPNDVSLYSNISIKKLKEAEEFYREIIVPRFEYHHGTFPNEGIQMRYNDYFETIITAVVFAYTALETFANICIPNDFKLVEENEGLIKTYLKKYIELKFTLRDKFKKVLRSILNTTDPTKESWWNDFIILEDLRNEIIHSKQLKSEERYSKLLSKKTFNLITIHLEVLKYYGNYINKNKKEMLDDFPYDLGYDGFYPILLNDADYESMYKDLHNIR